MLNSFSFALEYFYRLVETGLEVAKEMTDNRRIDPVVQL